MFVDSGEWYWNTGLFLANVKYLRKCLASFLPSVLLNLDLALPRLDDSGGERIRGAILPVVP